MSQAKLREALAGGAPTKEKGPPVADGVISETPDTPEAIEWRTKQSVIDSIASSSTYLDPEIETSPPSSVYGKFTWHIENFSDTSKRELRSGVFQVGPYRWYVLVYPQGCDVSNHLSLFLCVADYDKLLPGWGHYAQFTIAVVNKDPKKSKYSDTLHRFCKKEHDWGWKKFMELNKISDGFTVNDTLVIKAQVQVIPDRPVRPFRTLESQYRRELVRVYLTNVEGIVRRYVDEKREVLTRVLSGEGFIKFWEEQSEDRRKKLASAPAAPLFKSLIKKFFNEKEVTSTLVMDALYCGAKLLERAGDIALSGNGSNNAAAASTTSTGDEGASTTDKDDASKEKDIDALIVTSTSNPASLLPGLAINAATDRMFFAGDLVAALRRLVSDPVPAFSQDTKPTSDALALRNAQDVDDDSKGSVERDERRLADLGRRTVEMFGAAHIVETQLEAAWVEAETIKRQEELIREVEEASRGEAERAAAKAETEKEKKARKKERQRAKKEAEKAKKEAEEAEKQRQEEDRRAQAEKQRQEAEEKRKREEAEQEVEKARVRQAAEVKRQAELAAKAAAKAAKDAAKKAAAAKEQAHSANSAPAAAPAPAAAVTSRAGSHSSSSSNGTSPSSSTTEEVLSSDISKTPAVALSSSTTSGTNVNADRTPDLSTAPPRAVAASATIPITATNNDSVQHTTATTTTAGLVDALRGEIHRLTLIVNGKDEEILALRSRVAELESHFITSRPGSSLSQQASPEMSSVGAASVPVAYTASGPANGNNTSSNTSGNPSDSILATASMMPGGVQVPPPGMVVRPSSAGAGVGGNGNVRPMSANGQFASGTMGSYNKIRANGNGAPNGSGHSSSEGMPPPHPNTATAAAAGLMPPNGTRMYQGTTAQAPTQGARAFSSPLPSTKRDGLAPAGLESPGLDDFAHIGLINDLLE
jgi:hypothetical protein